MNIPRKTRDRLNALSLKVYGVSSRWQKILERQKIYEGHKVDKKATEKAQLSAQKMLNIGIDNEEVREMLEAEVKIPVYRSLSIPEVLEAMESMSDSIDYSTLPEAQVLEKAVDQFMLKKLRYEIALEVPADKMETVNGYLVELPHETSEQLKKVISEKVENKSAIRLDGLEFVRTLCERLANVDSQGEVS